ncbi:coiled-coil domain-containing protein 7 [Cavia porcellus]|uniref:coiled-coil domain-containing protein 7 n=1 Tax=Cavia porcellus TaxID=10141 RepID=UPI002FDF0B02
MKPAKHLPSSSNNLASITEFIYKKGQLKSPSSPKAKEKQGAKLVQNKTEPMTLQSPPTAESVVRYALPIPSIKTNELDGEDEVNRIIKHLKMVVSTLENSYGFNFENEELVVKPEQEDFSLSVGDNMNSFLVCCSQFAAQLEEAAKEEHHILESLFKWFQAQVNQMEEISKDHDILEENLPTSAKTVKGNIAQVVKLIQKLQTLRNHLKDGSKYSLKTVMSKTMKDEEKPSIRMDSYESVAQQIKEFVKTHSTEESMDTSTTESQIASSMTNQVNEMLKIFEKQTNELERAKNDQSLLEAKCKQMQNDFELLLEEKSVMENELQKWKDIEQNTQKTKPINDQTKKTAKTAKKKGKEKSEDTEKKITEAQQLKMKEDLLQVQKVADDLKIENKALQEKLKEALLISGVQSQRPNEESSEKKRSSPAISDLSETLKSQQKSALVSSNEISVDKNVSQISPSDTQDSPSVSWSKGSQDSFSFGKWIQKKKSAALLTALPMLTKDKSKADVSEEKLQRKTENETYPTAEKFQVLGEEANKTLLEHQDAMSKNGMQVRKQKTSKEGIHSTQDAEPDTSHMLEHQEAASKLEMKVKKQSISKEERHSTEDEEPDRSPVLEQQDAASKHGIQVQKQEDSREKSHSILDEEANKTLLEHQEAVSKNGMQVRKQKTSEEEIHSTQDEEPDTSPMLEHQDAASKLEMKVKKQSISKEERHSTEDEEPDRSPVHEQQDAASKHGIQVQKQEDSKEKSHSTEDEKPDTTPMLEQQDLVSQHGTQVKKQKSSKEKLHSTQTEETDKTPMLEHQDAVSKTGMEVKKQKRSKEKRYSTQDEEPDITSTLEHQGGTSKPGMQVKKQKASKEERHSTPDTHEDLESAVGYVGQIQTTEDGQVEELKTEDEVASKLPVTLQSLPALYPTIEDIISHLDLDKVVETDLELLKDAFGQHLQKDEFKTPSFFSPETDTDQFIEAAETDKLKSEFKKQLKNRPAPNIKHSTSAKVRGVTKETVKPQLENKPETGTERFPGIFGKNVRKEPMTQLKSYPETDIEPLTDVLRGGIKFDRMKIRPKSHLDPGIVPMKISISRRIIKGPVRLQVESHPDTNKEPLAITVGESITKEPVKTRLKSFPDRSIALSFKKQKY